MFSLQKTIKQFVLDKHLGQHFIYDEKITDKIVSAAGNITNVNVLEIGTGAGILTSSLAKQNPHRILTIEKDVRYRDLHSEILSSTDMKRSFCTNIEFLYQDVLRFNFACLTNKYKVVANLPYNISVTLLIDLLNNLDRFTSLTLLFQQEVAHRITANINEKNYGFISVLSQLLCNIKYCFTIKPGSFFPQPKVYSGLVHFIPKENRILNNKDIASFIIFLKGMFLSRRKTIRNALRNIGVSNTVINDFFNGNNNCNIDYRAQNLKPEDLLSLYYYTKRYK